MAADVRIQALVLLLSMLFVAGNEGKVECQTSAETEEAGKFLRLECPYRSLMLDHCYMCHSSSQEAMMICDGWNENDIQHACEGPRLIFHQTAGTYLSKDDWKRYGDPEEDNFSILDELESLRGSDGKFLFKIVWPELPPPNYNVWKQRNNPVDATVGGVVEYEAVEIHFTDQAWGGLEHNTGAGSLLDGSVDLFFFYYAVGSSLPFNNGIPGPYYSNPGFQKVELYVLSQVSQVALWTQVGTSNSRCETTGDDPHDITSQVACQLEAESAGSTWYSFSNDSLACYHSTTCSNPITGTTNSWRRFQKPGLRDMDCGTKGDSLWTTANWGTQLVICPSGCISGQVWGTGPFSGDSSICRAAIFQGVIAPGGGVVSLTWMPGQSSYPGGTQNGVTTSSFGSWSTSFKIGDLDL
eukprot:CAMPEP_0174281694 /NCGR_PEP_ID=MMETSP0809-20121228/2085_1 /TAXON_ID=73025 ORGANISM="Eutreptiella gymnastica-like, Strain CCMP1594" /NCGR_SAMPLE_ID=MMETSP0809 /ASSEMBLY_ACC=CAM_ASM_000658 /LENGTH=410 /DNA_ID=CAMNT_0015375393 /DNA_START=34 /DNA_END=1267 /DNA_ORIENTATION=+